MSRIAFQEPSGWSYQTTIYFPLSLIGFPPFFGVIVIV